MSEVPPVTVQDIVEGLLLFDEPILNTRYHEVLCRDQVGWRREVLERLPALVVRSHQHARSAAREWMNTRVDDPFILQGERVILEGFLSLAESQLRFIAFMARSAPTFNSRRPFEEMANLQRNVCHDLRDVLKGLASEPEIAPMRSVQEEDQTGDLRGQLEKALRERVRRGGVRRVVLSPTAQRHLRDQGLFRDGETTVLGTPVAIDLSWESAAFAIEGYDVVPLEEIFDDGVVGNGLENGDREDPSATDPPEE